jgi:hypothetical protein
MRLKLSFALSILGLMLLGSVASAQTNLLNNPGWDQTTGTVTLSDQFDDGLTFPEWQFYSLGGAVTYTAQADASAPSAPNILIYSKPAAVSDSAIRKDPFPAALTPGHTYELSLWIRDTDLDLNNVSIGMGAFDSLGGFIEMTGSKTVKATASWQKIVSTFVAADNYASGSYQIHMTDATGTVQMDSASVIDLGVIENLVNNPGWDIEAATVTVGTGQPAGEFNTNAAFTAWQVYALGNAPATGVYTTQADATAKSAPNVMIFQKVGSPGDAAIRSEASQFPLKAAHVYRSTVWSRGTANPVNLFIGLFDTNSAFIAPYGDITINATSDWQLLESTWLAPDNVKSGSFQLHLGAGVATNQFDDAYVEDATTKNRMTNSGFENSTSQLLNWGVVDFNGRGFGAALATNGEASSQSLRLYQTHATQSGSDGVLAKDAGNNYLPWQGTNEMYLKWSIKDDPTSDTGETVNVSVVCFDSAKAVISVPDGDTETVTSTWTSYVKRITTIPSNTAYISINFRIANGAGSNADVDDVLLDNVIVGDWTAGYRPEGYKGPSGTRDGWTLY